MNDMWRRRKERMKAGRKGGREGRKQRQWRNMSKRTINFSIDFWCCYIFLTCMSSFNLKAIILENRNSGLQELINFSNIVVYVGERETEREAERDRERESFDREKRQIQAFLMTKLSGKIKPGSLGPLGPKVKSSCCRTGDSVEIAYYWEQGYGCIRHSEVYLASVPFLA
jgi:hypothetical protein